MSWADSSASREKRDLPTDPIKHIDMVRQHRVDTVIAAGATIVDMDFFKALGFRHYRGSPISDDKRLRELYADRIDDTYIDEEQLQVCDKTVEQNLRAGACRRAEMRAMDRGWETEDTGRWAVPSAVTFFMLLPLLLSPGCSNRALEQARQEAREAKTTVNKLNYSLKTADEKRATIEAELSSVKQNRDELQKRLDQLVRERDQASMFAQRAQEAITRLTTETIGQGSTTVALQKQVSELKTLVEEQQKLIEQLQKGVPAHPATPPPAQATDKQPVSDPNEKP
jgi:hypothetical protein